MFRFFLLCCFALFVGFNQPTAVLAQSDDDSPFDTAPGDQSQVDELIDKLRELDPDELASILNSVRPDEEGDEEGRLSAVDRYIIEKLNKIEQGFQVLKNQVNEISGRQPTITVCKKNEVNGEGTFLPAEGKCVNAPDGAGSNAIPSSAGTKKCKSGYCKTAVVPAKRVYSTWVTAHKKITVEKPTPYMETVTEWDEVSCCWRKKWVTKYKNEPHEVVVPYKKQVIQSSVGHEEIEVCFEDL